MPRGARRPPLRRAVYTPLLHRLIISDSDRHARGWKDKFRIPGAAELTLDQAYTAMAWLGEEIQGAAGPLGLWTMTYVIEEALHRYRKDLFGEASVAFFDTTSLYFTGEGGQSLGRRGYSEDYRPHLKQAVLGVVLDGHDRPIASFLLPAAPPT